MGVEFSSVVGYQVNAQNLLAVVMELTLPSNSPHFRRIIIPCGQLMKSFYSSLKAGKGKLESLRTAKLEMIRQRRAANGATHRCFWASFVLVREPN